MDFEHIKLQFNRLKRHYESATSKKDDISLLDLTHCLRIWTEMKTDIDKIIEERKIDLNLPNPNAIHEEIKKALKGTAYTYLPLSTADEEKIPIKFRGITYVEGTALSDEALEKIFKAGVPQAKSTKLTFTQWLGSETLKVSGPDGGILGISREMLIKRTANILGASHPENMEKADDYEKQFDPHIRHLHAIRVANGYPLTYWQLIEIANIIVNSLGKIFE